MMYGDKFGPTEFFLTMYGLVTTFEVDHLTSIYKQVIFDQSCKFY